MTEFKKGDIVICHDDTHSHGQLKAGEEYTISKLVGTYVMLEGFVGHYRPDRFKLKVTHLPLYSEETAKAFLEERGYKVQPPPEPLKGQVYIMSFPGHETFFIMAKTQWDYHSSENPEWLSKGTLLAIVDWVEGQGLEK